MAEQNKRRESDRLFEYPFDFDAYIQKRLREIDDLDERKFAKTVLLEGLLKVILQTEEKYRNLERRVYEEIESQTGKYAIRSTVIEMEHYDPTNPTLFPVCPDDIKAKQPDLQEIDEARQAGAPLPVCTFFLRGDNELCARAAALSEIKGTLHTDKNTYPAVFHLARAKRYREALTHLYDLFMYNSIPWTTVNSCYMDKFFDVYLDTVEGTVGRNEKIESIKPDLEEFSSFIHYDMMPVWNVGRVEFSSKDFVVPCIDSRDYEHELPIDDFGIDNGYLVERNQEIVGIRRVDNKVIMRSPIEVFENWVGYKVVPGNSVLSLGYREPVLGNQKKDSFIARYMEHQGTRLHSKSDLYRRVGELELERFIEIKDFLVLPAGARCADLQDMNWFIKDELYPRETRRILMLKFKAVQPENYLNDAMVQFAVSQIQLDEGEYRCVGVLA